MISDQTTLSEAILDEIPTSLFVLKPDYNSRIVYAVLNKISRQITGFEKADYIGLSMAINFDPLSANKIDPPVSRVI